jgi:hypothetical protein
MCQLLKAEMLVSIKQVRIPADQRNFDPPNSLPVVLDKKKKK